MNSIQHLVRSANYWKMPKRCVASGCGNINNDGVMSLFSFPKDPVLIKKWTEQVKRTRDKWLGPTKYSFLCSCHFTEDSFQPDVVVAASPGLSKQRNGNLILSQQSSRDQLVKIKLRRHYL